MGALANRIGSNRELIAEATEIDETVGEMDSDSTYRVMNPGPLKVDGFETKEGKKDERKRTGERKEQDDR